MDHSFYFNKFSRNSQTNCNFQKNSQSEHRISVSIFKRKLTGTVTEKNPKKFLKNCTRNSRRYCSRTLHRKCRRNLQKLRNTSESCRRNSKKKIWKRIQWICQWNFNTNFRNQSLRYFWRTSQNICWRNLEKNLKRIVRGIKK